MVERTGHLDAIPVYVLLNMPIAWNPSYHIIAQTSTSCHCCGQEGSMNKSGWEKRF